MERAEQISTIKEAWKDYRAVRKAVASAVFCKNEIARKFLNIDFQEWGLKIKELEKEYNYFECEDCENFIFEGAKFCKNCTKKNKGSEVNQADYHNNLYL